MATNANTTAPHHLDLIVDASDPRATVADTLDWRNEVALTALLLDADGREAGRILADADRCLDSGHYREARDWIAEAEAETLRREAERREAHRHAAAA